jgi:hypothetical protein
MTHFVFNGTDFGAGYVFLVALFTHARSTLAHQYLLNAHRRWMSKRVAHVARARSAVFATQSSFRHLQIAKVSDIYSFILIMTTFIAP